MIDNAIDSGADRLDIHVIHHVLARMSEEHCCCIDASVTRTATMKSLIGLASGY